MRQAQAVKITVLLLLTSLFSLIFIPKKANAQLTIGVSIGGIGYHPQEHKNAQFYRWKFDKKGKFVGFASLSVLISYRFNSYLGVKAVNTFVFHDCAGKFSGISHIGIDFHDDIIGLKGDKNQLSMSVGPFWYYRKNWTKEPTYENDPNFIKLSANKKWESLFIWHGGQIQYQHLIDEHQSIGFNFLPAYPYLYSLSGSMYREY